MTQVLLWEINNSQKIDILTVPKSLTTRDTADNSTLEDPKAIYKTRKENPSAWVEIKIPPEILYNAKKRNCQHFSQAESKNTPFTQEPLKTKFNLNALTHEAELVLEGKYKDGDLDKVQKLFIDHLQ